MNPKEFHADQQHIRDLFVGTWNLITFSVSMEGSEQKKYPLGTKALGRIIYANDGYMNATLSHQIRPQFSVVLEQSHMASNRDKITAFDTYMNYSGRYLIFPIDQNSGTIEHHVDMALNPLLIGNIQIRKYNLVNPKQLFLSYDWEKEGRTGIQRYHFQLQWEKQD